MSLRFNFWLESRKVLHWQMAHMQFAMIPGADFSLKSSKHSSIFQHKADKRRRGLLKQALFSINICPASSDSVMESPECRFECKLHTLRRWLGPRSFVQLYNVSLCHDISVSSCQILQIVATLFAVQSNSRCELMESDHNPRSEEALLSDYCSKWHPSLVQ